MREVDVAMAIARHHDTGRFLVLKKGRWYRDNRDRYADNPWEVPGGKMQDDEQVAPAAQRELREETGLDGESVATADTYTVTHRDEHGEEMRLTFHPVLLEVTADEDAVTLNDTYKGEPEHETYAWIPAHELRDRLTENERPAIDRLVDRTDASADKEAALAVTRRASSEEYLLLRRAPHKERYPDRWSFPTGVMEAGETAREAALRELREETGLDGRVVRAASPYEDVHDDGRVVVHPFLVEVEGTAVSLDDEHTEYRWVAAEQVAAFETVGDLVGMQRLGVIA